MTTYDLSDTIITLDEANAAANRASYMNWTEIQGNSGRSWSKRKHGWGSDATRKSKMPWFLKTIDEAAYLLEIDEADDSFIALWARGMQETGAGWYQTEQGSRDVLEERYGYHKSKGRNLGNTQPGDGYTFRGRGIIQGTGKANYIRFGDRVGVDMVSDPDLMLSPEYAAEFVRWYIQDEMPRRYKWNTCYKWLMDPDLSLEERTYRLSACINWGFWQTKPVTKPRKDQIHGWKMTMIYARALKLVLEQG